MASKDAVDDILGHSNRIRVVYWCKKGWCALYMQRRIGNWQQINSRDSVSARVSCHFRFPSFYTHPPPPPPHFSTSRFMDAQILKLAKQTNRQGLVDFLDSKSLDEVGKRDQEKSKRDQHWHALLLFYLDFATDQVPIDTKLNVRGCRSASHRASYLYWWVDEWVWCVCCGAIGDSCYYVIGSPFASSKNGHAHMERRVLTFKTAFLW